MFTIILTGYGQAQIASHVDIESYMLLYDYIEDISTLSDIESYTVQLDDETHGNFKNNIGSIAIKDLSNLEYQAKTILFYNTVGGYKRILGGYSQDTPIIQKTTDILNVCLSFDFSAFTNGFSFAYISAGFSTATHNSDGIIHIENQDISSDDHYSVYNKLQSDSLLLKSVKDSHNLVIGTQTSNTSSWAGNINTSSLYNGQVVNYFVPKASVNTAVTLTLTLLDNTQTDSIPVYYRGINRVTTQFPAGSIIQLTYLENITIGTTIIEKGWFTNAFYYEANYNYYDRLRVDFRVQADTDNIYGNQIILRTDNDKYTSLCKSYGTSTTKEPTSLEFYLDSILYYGYSSTIPSGSATPINYLYRCNEANISYFFNTASLNTDKPVYLKVLYNSGTKKFYLDADNDWWAQDLPIEYDGYYYVYLGSMYNTSTLVLDINHPIYTYVEDYFYTGLKEVTPDYFNNDYITLSTEQIIASDKSLLGSKKLYLSPTKKSYLGDNNLALIDGTLIFSNSNNSNSETSLSASVLDDYSLEIRGNLLPQPYDGTMYSNYSLGSSSAIFNNGYIANIYGTLNGNASTASALFTANSIDGVKFDGSSSIVHFGRCDTAASTAIKDVSCEGFELVDGARIIVRFSNVNSATNPSLRIKTSSSTTLSAISIHNYASYTVTNADYSSWGGGNAVEFVYDATNNYFLRVGYQHYSYASQSATTATYSTYVGSSNTNYVATYSYSSATSRSLRPIVNYSSTSYVNLGSTSYKWGYIYGTYLGNSSNYFTSAYITNMYGTAEKATSDSAGNNINSTYIKSITNPVSSSSTITVYNTTAGGTTSSSIYAPTSNLRLIKGDSTNTSLSLENAVASVLSATNSVGMIRLVAFKSTAAWAKTTSDIYIDGSILRPVDLRTEDSTSDTVLRINATTTLNNSVYTGTWRVLHRIGNVSSGNTVVALAIRIL